MRLSRSRPEARLKVTTFTVRASQVQARRWAVAAKYLGYRSVSAWLRELAEEQALRVEDAAVRAASAMEPKAPPRVSRTRGPYRRRP